MSLRYVIYDLLSRIVKGYLTDRRPAGKNVSIKRAICGDVATYGCANREKVIIGDGDKSNGGRVRNLRVLLP